LLGVGTVIDNVNDNIIAFFIINVNYYETDVGTKEADATGAASIRVAWAIMETIREIFLNI
jgi:hypothetical protein